jgi:ABC-type antimicrobial peptide transport system permease subunit
MTAIVENWRIALGSLRANWFRALLTALGVVIGVASLIAVSAVSAGAQADVAASIDRLGGNVIKVDGETITTGARSTTDRTLTPEDVDAVRKLPSVAAVAPHQDIESLTVSAGRHRTATWLVGQTAEYSVIQNQRASWGRTISAGDVTYGRSVMVLGTVPRRKLFPGETAIGKTVRVGNQEFEVVGIQARRGKLADENLDNRIFVPLPLVTGVLVGGGANVVHLDVLVDGPGAIAPTIDATE